MMATMDESPFLAYLRREREKCASALASLESEPLSGGDAQLREAVIPVVQSQIERLTASIEAEEGRRA